MTRAPLLAGVLTVLVAQLAPSAAAAGPDATLDASTDDRAAAQVQRRIDERFARPSSIRRFDDTGPGRWEVRGGRLGLDASPRRSTRTRVPTTLHRRTVRGTDWRLDVDMRTEGRKGDASVLVDRTGPRDHVEVHLATSRRRSGVYAVRDGARTRIAALRLAARPGVSHRVRVVHEGSTMTVTVRRPGLRRSATVGVPLVTASRVGLGSRGGLASFDNLSVVERRPGRSVTVSTSTQLAAALADARPGDTITMADGTYTTKGLQADLPVGDDRYYGTFVASRSGTAAAPVVLQGSRSAVIDGAPGDDGTSTQYGLYLAGVEHVRVQGITVRNVSKGVVADRSAHVTISSVLVEDIGQEGIHLRAGTHHSEVADSVVRRTGLDNASFGEGIYVGSAESNWSTYSDGNPDASDHNRILRNTISQTGAESVDIKEGTSHGLLEDNVFDGAGMSGSFADSWVDVKGSSWLVRGNRGTTALEDGFQVHVILDGWGQHNVFSANVADVRGPGYGFWVQDGAAGTVVGCDNVVRAAASGFSSEGPCTEDLR